MVRRKIQIKKIENTAARQVTFSKRRRGLFKKAEELSTLCDAQIGLLVFSASGKLYQLFSNTSSMQDIIHKRNMHFDRNGGKSTCTKLSDQVTANKTEEFRHLSKEELNCLDMEGLNKLEGEIEQMLARLRHIQVETLQDEVAKLKKKESMLMEENKAFKKVYKVVEETSGWGSGEEAVRPSSESTVGVICCIADDQLISSRNHADHDQFFDTSLRLGLPTGGSIY